MDKKALRENIHQAISWIATEHNYFLELKKDISRLKVEIETAKANADLKGLKVLWRDVRYIGRSERRFNRYEHNVESILSKMKDKIKISGTIAEVEELVRRLHLEAADLINSSSRYEGRLHDLLVHLQAAIKSKDLGQAHQCIMELSELAENTEKWIAALSTDLNEAKRMSEEFEEIYGEDLEGIKEKLKHLTPDAQWTYLIILLGKKKSFPKNTYEGIKKRLYELAESNKWFIPLAKEFEVQGEFEEAGNAYVADGCVAKKCRKCDCGKKGNCINKAIECYKKAGKLELAAKIASYTYRFEEAINIYEQMGDWKKALDVFESWSDVIISEMYEYTYDTNQYRLLGEVYAKAARMLEKFGQAKLAKKMWSRVTAINYSGTEKDEWARVAMMFGDIKKWKLAGDAWNKAGEINKARKMYRKAKRD